MYSLPGFNVVASSFTKAILFRLLGLWIVYRFIRVLYNISPLHPLSHIPGPRLAAATFLYEGWFDLVLGGRYTEEIIRMHEVYGPLVRINPEELHFNDIEFVDEIYATGARKRDKQVHFLNFVAGAITSSMFATVQHDLHRVRRTVVNKFFSRAQISKLEPGIKNLADQLCDKIISLGKSSPVCIYLPNATFVKRLLMSSEGIANKTPLDVTTAYSCFTSDVISGYCFGEPFGLISQKGWEPNFREPLNALLASTFLFRFFPPLRVLVNIAPLFAKWAGEDFRNMLTEMDERMPARIRKTKQDREAGIKQERPSIFTTILDSSLPDAEKTDRRLGGEGFSMISAGTDPTAWTLTVITFYLLDQPDTLAHLSKELEDANATNLAWLSLEKLPYLSAVISEGLRLAYGVPSRLPRIAPQENLIYRGRFQGMEIKYTIPSGTPMGMSNAINHHDEDVFPESDRFRPERWLDLEEAQRRRMKNSLTPFSKGSRQCLGMK